MTMWSFKQPAVYVSPGSATLVKFDGPWVPARQKEIEMADEVKQKGTPNIRFEVKVTCDIRSDGLEQLKADDMANYVRFILESSQLGYDPIGWLRRREELGLRMEVNFDAAFRPPRGHKWREVDCSALNLRVSSKGRK